MTFVVKGLSEVYDPRGGFPVKARDGLVVPNFDDVYAGKQPKDPAAGSEIARVTAIARQLIREPDLRGLTPRQLAQIANWKLPTQSAPPPFSVFEKTVSQMQDAMSHGQTTSEDITREYLARAAVYDRNGPTFRAILSLNPRAIADARAATPSVRLAMCSARCTAYRCCSKTTSTSSGFPPPAVRVRSSNIDRDSIRALPPECEKAAPSCSARRTSTSFPSAISASAPSAARSAMLTTLRSVTAGSSGGSATAVATAWPRSAFGTDTCNSLSNPSGFASLATIRATRGLVSRAGVMPLNPYNDAVGPIAKSATDVALALDLVAGTDPEDPATAEANRHISGSFAEGLDAATLKGRRIGVLRQRFVGVTGEREVATEMDRVIKEFEAAGATLFDVHIPDYDAKFRAARGSARRCSRPRGRHICRAAPSRVTKC